MNSLDNHYLHINSVLSVHYKLSMNSCLLVHPYCKVLPRCSHYFDVCVVWEWLWLVVTTRKADMEQLSPQRQSNVLNKRKMLAKKNQTELVIKQEST